MFTKISFLFVVLLCSIQSFAQMADLEEKKPETVNGIEYGYYIKNEQTKSVKDEEYGRFEITLYAINKTGCTKIYAEKTTPFFWPDAQGQTPSSRLLRRQPDQDRR